MGILPILSQSCFLVAFDVLQLDLKKRCNQLGMTESDYIERLVAVSLYGIEHVQMIERKRIEEVCGLSGLYPVKDPAP